METFPILQLGGALELSDSISHRAALQGSSGRSLPAPTQLCKAQWPVKGAGSPPCPAPARGTGLASTALGLGCHGRGGWPCRAPPALPRRLHGLETQTFPADISRRHFQETFPCSHKAGAQNKRENSTELFLPLSSSIKSKAQACRAAQAGVGEAFGSGASQGFAFPLEVGGLFN